MSCEARARVPLVTVWRVLQATSPYLSGVPGSTYTQYYGPQLMPAVLGHDPAGAAASPLGVMQQPVLQQKLPRTDRLEVRQQQTSNKHLI